MDVIEMVKVLVYVCCKFINWIWIYQVIKGINGKNCTIN